MKNSIILWAVSGCAAVALAVACGSSSSNPTTPPATDGGPEVDSGSSSGGGSGSSGGSDAAMMMSVACTDRSMCASGQICCATGTAATACETGSCPLVAGMMIQLCATDAECPAANPACYTFALMPAIKVCQKGDGGTATTEGGTSEAGTDAASEAGPTEAGPSDAAGGG